MGFSYKFADNVTYGAEDINSVISDIVTEGIADVYFDGLSYNTSDLNKIANAITSAGVQYVTGNSCKAEKYSAGKIRILAGKAFFRDGSMIEIDSDGVILSYSVGEKNYVYLKGNIEAENKNEVCCTTEPGNGDIVNIAEIDGYGNIIDRREFCKGKIGGYQSGGNNAKKITVIYKVTGGQGGYQDFEFDLGGYGYSHVVDITKKEKYMQGDRSSVSAIGIYDLVNSYAFTMCIKDGDHDVVYNNKNGILISPCNGTSVHSADIWAAFKTEGTILKVRILLTNTESTTYVHKGTVIFLVA